MNCNNKVCNFCLIDEEYDTYIKEKDLSLSKLYKGYPYKGIIKNIKPYNYRHKVIASFKRSKDKVVCGLYQENSHDLIVKDNCLLQHEIANQIIVTVTRLANKYKMTVFSEKSGYGLLRHLVIRVSKYNNDVLLTIVTNKDEFIGKNNFIKQLVNKHPNIKSVVINQNPRQTSVVLGDKEIVSYGSGYIIDELDEFKFRISSKSFYQVNPYQTEILYRKAIELADIKDTDIVIDAYSGIGTISLFASKYAKEVIGVEINSSSIKDAITNAKYNQVTNVKFINQDASKYMVDYKGTIDVLIVDPTRSGLDKIFISAINKLKPKKIVYISCNPETQIRDIKQLKSLYSVKNAYGVDMFSFTKHIESVVSLTLNKK